MVHLRSASKCVVIVLLLCAFTNIIECGRGGGGRSSGGSRSSSSGSRSSSSSGSRSGGGWFGWGSRSSSSSSSNRGSSSSYGSQSSVNLSPSRTSSSSNTHGTSHVLPISTGSRNEISHSSTRYGTQSNSPSAPPINSQHNIGGSHVPSAPPLPTGNNKPAPAAGWNVGNDGSIRREQTQGLNNANNNKPAPGWNVGNQPGPGQHPPPYPGAPNYHPNAPPPPYPGAANHHPNGPPPPYPGGVNHHPNGPPPPYSVNNYPGPPLSGAPPPYPGTSYPGAGHYSNANQHYPGGAPNYGMGGHYQNQHYPPYHYSSQSFPQSNNLPPPPPGYSPYGVPYYQKPSSGISANHVMMGLALWQISRPHTHHHFYGSGYDNYNSGYGYHEFNRQRYTTTYGSQNSNSNAPGAHNTVEMTHYVIPDEKGAYKTVVGNMTCLSLYDAKSVSQWANRTMDDFYRKFPGSEFPLFETGKNTTNKFENFTMIPGRIIHEEPVSVTCCGTDKGPLELSMLTNGKSPDVNCLHFRGKIPFRKLTFMKINHVIVNASMEDWKPIDLVEPNMNSTSTPTPLAPFPVTLNATESVSSTTPSVDLNQTFVALGVNNVSSSTTVSTDLNIENATFPSLGNINSTISHDSVPSLESKNDTSALKEENVVNL